jgi:hypothetical protein
MPVGHFSTTGTARDAALALVEFMKKPHTELLRGDASSAPTLGSPTSLTIANGGIVTVNLKSAKQ